MAGGRGGLGRQLRRSRDLLCARRTPCTRSQAHASAPAQRADITARLRTVCGGSLRTTSPSSGHQGGMIPGTRRGRWLLEPMLIVAKRPRITDAPLPVAFAHTGQAMQTE
jgi:hypothetical protein